jgi:hypothetical protein
MTITTQETYSTHVEKTLNYHQEQVKVVVRWV